MASLLIGLTEVTTFVLAGFTTVVTEIVDNPLLLLFVAIGVAGMVIGFVKSFIHT